MGYGAEAVTKTRQVLLSVADGESLGKALKLNGLNGSTFHEVLAGVRELALEYARSREIRADIEADEAKEIADDDTLDPQQAKNRIDIRKWRASKFNSRVFGDRVDLNVTSSISVSGALEEARSRVASRVVPILDAEILSTLPGPDPSEEDIFS